MDVVYLVKGPNQASGNEDLRYSLRSLAANIPHDQIWIVGYCPRWLTGVRHINSRSSGDKWWNLPTDLMAAARHPEISDSFAYWNDDFFALTPQDVVPLRHRGLLSAYVGRRGAACSSYVMGQRQTLALLRSWGYEEPRSYETHMPLVMDKPTVLEALGRALAEFRGRALAYRSVYGAVAGLEGSKIEDMKMACTGGHIPAGWQWISTSDRSFGSGRIGRELRAMFPQPCAYERSEG